MRNILLLFTYLISFVGFGQYCPYLGPDQLLPCGVSSTTLTADLTQCGIGGVNPNQTTNYNVTNIPYVTQTNNGTTLSMSDDSQQGPFNIGFNFCFFGTTYTQFWIGSNGWISFSPAQPTTFTSQTIPTTNGLVPKNCIMGPWQDWHPGIGGQIKYQIQGVAPCRKLIVSWVNVPMFSCTSNLGTFHIVIYETTNLIENHIQNKPSCLQWQNGTSVEGVHNLAGTIGVTVPGRNSTAWVAQNDSWRWTPSGPIVTPTLTWYQVGNPVPIGTGPTITVNPPIGGANYTCQFVYPICNAGWVTCNGSVGNLGPDTVFVMPGPPNLPLPTIVLNNPTCDDNCDGSILVSPNGGNGVQTISWNGTETGYNPTNLCSGNYTFTLIDGIGCSISSNVTLIDPPQLLINPIIGEDTICFNSTNNLYNITNASVGINFTWSLTNGNIVGGQGTEQISIDANGIQSGLYNDMISVYGIDVNGCQSQTEVFDINIFNVNPFINPVGPFCSYDEFITLESFPVGGYFTGNGIVNNDFYPENAVGTNNITYTYTQSGCIFNTTETIIVYQQPIIETLTPDNPYFEVCVGDSVNIVFNITTNLQGNNQWLFMDSIYESNIFNNSFSDEGVYLVSVTTTLNGCVSNPEQTTVTIDQCPEELIYIPNSFTPDGDEHNNIWKPIFTSGFDPYDFKLEIYNRWGELLWTTKNSNVGWDGTYNGNYCQDGIYIWKLEFGIPENDGRKLMFGHLTTIR
jgi:gliding motility-associated-like protein